MTYVHVYCDTRSDVIVAMPTIAAKGLAERNVILHATNGHYYANYSAAYLLQVPSSFVVSK